MEILLFIVLVPLALMTLPFWLTLIGGIFLFIVGIFVTIWEAITGHKIGS